MLRPFAAVLSFAALTALGAQHAEAQGSNRPARPQQQEVNPVPQPRPEKQFPLGASWSAISINGRVLGGERPSLLVDEQLRAKGFAGCNTFSATAYPLREMGFVVGPVAVTRKACDGGATANERTFLVALRGARKWDVVNGQLVIQGVAGELKFERAL
ncbi:MAG: META domain-containing protein [Bosea sp. (in: a-proteobacteria)]